MKIVKQSKEKGGLGEETGIERLKAKKSKKGSRNLDGELFFGGRRVGLRCLCSSVRICTVIPMNLEHGRI